MQLSDLVRPGHTAVVLSEMQRAICGDLAPPPTAFLAQAVREQGVVPRLRALMDGGHQVGVPTVHATLQFHRNRAGTKINSPMMARTMKDPDYLVLGSDQAEVIPELAPSEQDVVHRRIHGMSAFNGTELDAILRSMDITTIIIGGVSLNEAIIGMAIEAVNLGYSIAVVSDGSVGLPQSFAEQMLTHCFAPLGKVTTVEEVLQAWGVEPA
jgi:nicotinamidase-related amidase